MVPPEKQKIIFKGKTLKDDASYAKAQAKFKTGALLGLMGKAEDKARDLENIERKVFIEDLSKEERAKYLKENFGVVEYKLTFFRKFWHLVWSILATHAMSTLLCRL